MCLVLDTHTILFFSFFSTLLCMYAAAAAAAVFSSSSSWFQGQISFDSTLNLLKRLRRLTQSSRLETEKKKKRAAARENENRS